MALAMDPTYHYPQPPMSFPGHYQHVPAPHHYDPYRGYKTGTFLIPYQGPVLQGHPQRPSLRHAPFTPSAWFNTWPTTPPFDGSFGRTASHHGTPPSASMPRQVLTFSQAQSPTQLPEASKVPDTPRGPPKKPKQSGHHVWIGNLPANTSIYDLKDHCARGAGSDIESVFLISRSNCAFANYNSLAACEAAITRLRTSSFQGRQLVCRLRMGSNSSSSSTSCAASDGPARSLSTASSLTPPSTPGPDESEPRLPVIVGSSTPPMTTGQSDVKPRTPPPAAPEMQPTLFRVPERFFIIKSLTVQDLIASVNNGTWEAQSHIEQTLQHAFLNSDNVYLLFSANKSGEYFGLARMSSDLYVKEPQAAPAAQTPSPTSPTMEPHTGATSANDMAPSGKIYDDSARGTVFWEADGANDGVAAQEEAEARPSRHFNVQWLSTARVPFYRTRGLRNPWNGLKEVKIARDGTELEPTVGGHLVRLFGRTTGFA